MRLQAVSGDGTSPYRYSYRKNKSVFVSEEQFVLEALHGPASGAEEGELGAVGAGTRRERLVAAGAGPRAHVFLAVQCGRSARPFTRAQRKVGQLGAQALRRHASGAGGDARKVLRDSAAAGAAARELARFDDRAGGRVRALLKITGLLAYVFQRYRLPTVPARPLNKAPS